MVLTSMLEWVQHIQSNCKPWLKKVVQPLVLPLMGIVTVSSLLMKMVILLMATRSCTLSVNTCLKKVSWLKIQLWQLLCQTLVSTRHLIVRELTRSWLPLVTVMLLKKCVKMAITLVVNSLVTLLSWITIQLVMVNWQLFNWLKSWLKQVRPCLN